MRGHKPYCGNQGAVLVIALIMLAVVTFIVIAYLAFAQRDRTSVNMSIIQTENRLLLDAALADAQRNISEKIKKDINYQLTVSTNSYESTALWAPVIRDSDGDKKTTPLVLSGSRKAKPFGLGNLVEMDDNDPFFSLDHKGWAIIFADGTRCKIVDVADDLKSIQIDGQLPNQMRPQVFTLTREEHRFNLDLNRDGFAQPTRGSPEGNLTWKVGDPHWIGVLKNPTEPHSRENQFVGRYAYMVVPVSKALDLNNIHNNFAGGDYGRVGDPRADGRITSSSLSLAGTLSALNLPPGWPNVVQPEPPWPYWDLINNDQGMAFAHALGLFKYQQNVEPFYDIFDLYAPAKPNPQGFKYDPFTILLEKAGGDAFYDLAGSVSTIRQPAPSGRLNLHQYKNLISPGITIAGGPHDGIADTITTTSEHGWPNGARVCLYSDNELMPTWTSNSGATSQEVHSLHVFYVKASEESPTQLQLFQNFKMDSNPNDDVNDEEFSNPIEFTSGFNSTAYRLDRSLEMYEEVAARLLKARAKATRSIHEEIVKISESGRPEFNIIIRQGDSPPTSSLDSLPAGAQAIFEAEIDSFLAGTGYGLAGGINKNVLLQYSPEIERLLQVAANIVDVYTPGQFPTVFRPVFASRFSGPMQNYYIKQFCVEPNGMIFYKPTLAGYVSNPSITAEELGSISTSNLPYSRVKSFKYTGITTPQTVPLIIGAKNRWGSNKPSPAINEINIRLIMNADAIEQKLIPRAHVSIEVKDLSSGIEPMKLWINGKLTGSIDVHGTQGMPASGNYNNPSAGIERKLYDIQFAENFDVNSTFPLTQIDIPMFTLSSNSTMPMSFPGFDRHPYEMSGNLEISMTLTDYKSNIEKCRIIDHVDVTGMSMGDTGGFWDSTYHPDSNSSTTFQRLGNQNNPEFKKNDEVWFNGERYFYRADNPITLTDARNDRYKVQGRNLKTGALEWLDAEKTIPKPKEILHPARWTMLNWNWNQVYSGNPCETGPGLHPNAKNISLQIQHPPVYPQGKVLKYTIPVGAPNAGKNLLFHCNSIYPPNEIISDHQNTTLLDYYAGEQIEWSWQVNDPFLNGRLTDYHELHNGGRDNKKDRNHKPILILKDGTYKYPENNMGKENVVRQPWMDSSAIAQRNLENIPDHLRRDLPDDAKYPEDINNYFFKDPLLKSGLNWNFPMGYLKSVGDLGRIHRGSPWQTLFFKASPGSRRLTLPNGVTPTQDEMWREWVLTRSHTGNFEGTGNMGVAGPQINTANNRYLYQLTHPAFDRLIIDELNVFPDNHELQRGLLSINQGKYPAWAAAISGIEVDNGDYAMPGPKMKQVVRMINQKRNSAPWRRYSDILQVPGLSYGSPYLPEPASEEHYEAIPRGVLPQLRLEEEDRFVAYTYSQVLRPARRGISMTEVTNYKVVGEGAARTVFKVNSSNQVVVESYTPMNIR